MHADQHSIKTYMGLKKTLSSARKLSESWQLLIYFAGTDSLASEWVRVYFAYSTVLLFKVSIETKRKHVINTSL